MASTFDIFLSHNSSDKPPVEEIGRKLKAAGLTPWLDKWELVAGTRWQGALADGLRGCAACGVFIGPGGIGDWAREELEVAQNRAAKEPAFRLIPILLPGLREPFDLDALPPFLTTRTWVDFRKGLHDSRPLDVLIKAIKGIAPGPELPIAADAGVCPYRGLQAFDEQHAEFFFGRESEVQRLLEKLKGTRFLAVMGSSGSGKSSLVRAALIPRLRGGALPEIPVSEIRIFTPGAHPLAALAAQLLRLFPGETMQQTVAEMARDPQSLRLAVTLALAEREGTVVWVVDQLEEIFTLCADPAERQQFLLNLLYAAAPGERSVVIVTMRADFYPKCAAHPEFSARAAAQQYLVSPMGSDGLREAIEQPARRVGLEFEQGLVDTIIDDVAAAPGALPLLEHALLELWQSRRGRMMTLEAYRETGGVNGAIAARAESIYTGATPAQQEALRRIMLRLTQPGEGTEDTRRRATLSEIGTEAGEEDAVEKVLQLMTQSRLLTVDADAQAGETIVDVSHEALIRGWPRLRQWINDDRAALRVHRRVTDAAQEWERGGRDPGGLFRGARLAQAVEWRERHEPMLNSSERAFLDASVAAIEAEQAQERARQQRELEQAQALAEEERRRAALQQRAARQTRIALVVVVFFLVFAVTAAFFALVQKREANRAQTVAESTAQSAQAARARTLAGQPGREFEALDVAMQAAAPSVQKHSALPPAVLGGLATSLAAIEAALPLHGHPGPVRAVIFSSDGRRLLTASTDVIENSGRLWDAATGRLITTVPFSPALIALETPLLTRATFSADGKFFVVPEGQKDATIRDTASGKIVQTLAGHTAPVSMAVFSPDGSRVMTTAFDGTVRLWTASSGQSVWQSRTDKDADDTSMVFFSKNGTRVLTMRGKETTILDATNGQPLETFAPRETAPNEPASKESGYFSVDLVGVKSGQRLAELITDPEWQTVEFPFAPIAPDRRSFPNLRRPTLELREMASGKPIEAFKVKPEIFQGDFSSAAFSADGQRLAVAAKDHRASILDAATGTLQRTLTGHSDDVVCMDFSPDGRFLATGSEDRTARIWRLQARDRALAMVGEASPPNMIMPATVSDAAFSPDSRLVLTAHGEGKQAARLWEVATGKPVAKLAHFGVEHAAFSPDGSRIVTSSSVAIGLTRLWDAKTRAALADIEAEAGGLSPGLSAFSPDSRMLLVTRGGSWTVHDARDGKAMPQIAGGTLDWAKASFATGPAHLVAEDRRYGSSVYEFPSGNKLAGFPLSDFKEGFCAPARDASRFVTLALAVAEGQADPEASDRIPLVWDGAGKLLTRLRGHTDAVTGAALDPSARRVVTVSKDATARLWETDTGRQLATLEGHSGELRFARFSPDGSLILTIGDDEPRLWDAATGAMLAVLSGTPDSIGSAAFSPDGTRIILASYNGTARLFSADPRDFSTEYLRAAFEYLRGQGGWDWIEPHLAPVK